MASNRTLGGRSFENVLKTAEGGSLKSLRALGDGWPKDISNEKRALVVLLNHLDRSKIPDLRRGWSSLSPDGARQVLIIKTSVGSLERAFDCVCELGEAHIKEMVPSIRDYLPDFLAALEFIATYSSLIMEDHITGIGAAQLGNLSAANHIRILLEWGAKYFRREEDHDLLTLLVDHLVNAWLRPLRDAPPPSETTVTPAAYEYHCVLHQALKQCTSQTSTAELLRKAVASLDKKRLDLFAGSFSYRCTEWVTVHTPPNPEGIRKVDCSPLMGLIPAARQISAVPVFERALVKTGFFPLVVRYGWMFRDAPAIPPFRDTIDTEIASQLFPRKGSRTYTFVHTFPALLGGGLLDIILLDFLSHPRGDYSTWDGENPLLGLFLSCHHPRIADALSCAREEILESTRRAVEADPAVQEIFDEFMESIEPYETASREQNDREFPLMCACLEHHAEGYMQTTLARQCSQCKTVVYCSEKCQADDWHALHKKECLSNRAHRIECELAGAWLSHRQQVHYIHALEIYFRSNILDTILPLNPHPSQSVGVVPATRPVSVYFIPTTDMPLRHLKYEAESLLSLPPMMGKVALFSGRRFQAIVDAVQAREDVELVALLASYSMLGEVGVCAMAAFLLDWDGSDADGRLESPDSADLLLLHHYIQIVGPVRKSG